MHESPSLSRFTLQQGATSDETAAGSQAIAQHPWRNLLRPESVGNAVLVADLCLIIITSLCCSFAYHWATSGVLANVTSAAGVGVVIAINFVAIMAARRNYPIKQLM